MRTFFALYLALLLQTCYAQSELRVMYYNLLNFPGSTPNRADTLKVICDYVQPDVLLVCELSSQAGADLVLNTVFNTSGATVYERATFVDGPDSDNMIYFNSDKFGLANQYVIPTALRNIGAYRLYCKTPDIATTTDTIFLNFFVAHLKASSGSTNESARALEVMQLKNSLADNPNLENVFFGGDFNLYSSNEPAWENILNGAGYALFDPISMPGTWNNAAFASIHTQSTRDTQFGGGASGGMDDRFDFIFFNEDLLNATHGVEYVAGSYEAVGQDGLRYNGSIVSPANQAVPQSVASALYYMSDHLPVALKINVPAFLQDTTSVNELRQGSSFALKYSNHELSWEQGQGSVSLQIFTVDGKLLTTREGLHRNTYSVNNLEPGIYVARLTNENNTSTELKFTTINE